jgi:Holliday junction resolvase-like predicted endonuclease
MDSNKIGEEGERRAKELLKQKGYSILGGGKVEYGKTPYGEIDILAGVGSKLVAVEVKTSGTIEEARSYVSKEQIARIDKTMRLLLASREYGQFMGYRIEAICVSVGSDGRMEHYDWAQGRMIPLGTAYVDRAGNISILGGI